MFKFNNFTTKNNSQLGFTMIELAVSIMILSVSFFALWQALPFSLKIIKTSENTTKASYLAQAKLEEIRSLGYDNCGLGTIEPKQRLGSSTSYLYNFQRETNIDYIDTDFATSTTDTGMKLVNIKIYHINSLSKNENTYEINTLITKR